MTPQDKHAEARAYYALCDEAQALGVDTSLDTNPQLDTVAKLQAAVAEARS